LLKSIFFGWGDKYLEVSSQKRQLVLLHVLSSFNIRHDHKSLEKTIFAKFGILIASSSDYYNFIETVGR
jgi:hypothetical protein